MRARPSRGRQVVTGRSAGETLSPYSFIRAAKQEFGERCGNAARMSRRAESLSVFVVQRHFRQVRRGYDPAEVDRHLDVISQWLNGSHVAQAVREGEAALARLEREAEEAVGCARSIVDDAQRGADTTLKSAPLMAAGG